MLVSQYSTKFCQLLPNHPNHEQQILFYFGSQMMPISPKMKNWQSIGNQNFQVPTTARGAGYIFTVGIINFLIALYRLTFTRKLEVS